MMPAWAYAANKTVTVLVLAEKQSAPDGVIPAAWARIEVIPEEGAASVAFADQNGKAIISYPESRSFVISVVAGVAQSKRTNRFYGRMDQVVSVFMGTEPSYGQFGDLYATITSAATGAERGLPKSFREKFENTQIDIDIAVALKSGKMTDEEANECRVALAKIRNAPLLHEAAINTIVVKKCPCPVILQRPKWCRR